jgi:hypothetical protein
MIFHYLNGTWFEKISIGSRFISFTNRCEVIASSQHNGTRASHCFVGFFSDIRGGSFPEVELSENRTSQGLERLNVSQSLFAGTESKSGIHDPQL